MQGVKPGDDRVGSARSACAPILSLSAPSRWIGLSRANAVRPACWYACKCLCPRVNLSHGQRSGRSCGRNFDTLWYSSVCLRSAVEPMIVSASTPTTVSITCLPMLDMWMDVFCRARTTERRRRLGARHRPVRQGISRRRSSASRRRRCARMGSSAARRHQTDPPDYMKRSTRSRRLAGSRAAIALGQAAAARGRQGRSRRRHERRRERQGRSDVGESISSNTPPKVLKTQPYHLTTDQPSSR